MGKRETVRQMSLMDTSDEYTAFVEKFKPKKTTDDCYTPENIFDTVVQWCVEEYGVDREKIVRPFWPGGDYEREEYPEGCVVLDNPPFSIISQVVRFYEENEIKYFLFAPVLTILSIRAQCSIIASANITYENGATVATGFVTNLDDKLARSVPELGRRIKTVNDENRKEQTKTVPKYEYPDNVLSSAMLNYLASHDTRLDVDRNDASFIRALDSQRAKGKAIFGAGYLLSEKAAAEKAAAEKWELSENEIALIKSLGRQTNDKT